MNILRIVYCLLMSALGNLRLVSAEPRIIGGNTTTIEKHPWQVSIQIFGLHSCGGSIINADTILTAAHCIDEILVTTYQVIVGTTDLSKPFMRSFVKESIIHDKYDSTTYDYDIAILKLRENLTFSNIVQPIVLPSDGFSVSSGTKVVTSGWGFTEPNGSQNSDVLLEVELNVIEWEVCYRKLSPVGLFTNRMICAGVPEGGKDTCQGDSGGAVELDGTLVGIVSWGKNCGDAAYPGVYSSISYLRSWIRDHANV